MASKKQGKPGRYQKPYNACSVRVRAGARVRVKTRRGRVINIVMVGVGLGQDLKIPKLLPSYHTRVEFT